MNREQAIAAMKKGSKVRHHHFIPGEFITSDSQGNIYDENGLLLKDFWQYRNSDPWDRDWEAYPVFADKCYHPGTLQLKCKELFEYKNWHEFVTWAERRSLQYADEPLLYISRSGIVCYSPSDFVEAHKNNDWPVKAYQLTTFKTIKAVTNEATQDQAV